MLELKEEEARLQEEDWLQKEEARLLAGLGSAPACPACGEARGPQEYEGRSCGCGDAGCASAGDGVRWYCCALCLNDVNPVCAVRASSAKSTGYVAMRADGAATGTAAVGAHSAAEAGVGSAAA
eukprot:SAG11_NODE_15843_length_564_cov_2.206452_1_plen_123_part_10